MSTLSSRQKQQANITKKGRYYNEMEYKPITEEDLRSIRNFIIEKIARNHDAMFFDDNIFPNMCLTDIIFALYEALHRAVMHENYDYMWHWCNKIGAWCNECATLNEIIKEGDAE